MGFIKAKLNQFTRWFDANGYKMMNVTSYIITFAAPIISVIYFDYDKGNFAGAFALGIIIVFIGIVTKELSNYYAPYVGIPVLDHRLTERHSDRSDITYDNVPLMIQYLSDLEDWFESNGYL